MNVFTLHLQSATQYERVEGVTSFAGEDASGSFGLLARHARFMTVLSFGMARFRAGGGKWEYLALPGGLVYFRGNELYVSTRRFLRGPDYEKLRTTLEQQFAAEEGELQTIKKSLRHLEQEMLKRLVEMQRGKPA